VHLKAGGWADGWVGGGVRMLKQMVDLYSYHHALTC